MSDADDPIIDPIRWENHNPDRPSIGWTEVSFGQSPPTAPTPNAGEEPVIHAYIQIQFRGSRADVEKAMSDITAFAKRKFPSIYAGETGYEHA